MITKYSFTRFYKGIGFSLAAVLLLDSCHLIKRYPGPSAPVPIQWKNSPPPIHEPDPPTEEKTEDDDQTEEKIEQCQQNLGNWWEVFEDDVLTQLEQEAVYSNYDLWAALERVISARSLAYESLSYLSPQVTFAPSVSRYGLLAFNPLSQVLASSNAAGGSSSSSSANAAPVPNPSSLLGTLPAAFRTVQSQYQLPINLSYEIDLWRKLQSRFDSALYHYQATTEDYLNIYLTLTAEIASNYFMLRDLDSQLVILERTIKSRQRAYDINHTRYNAGIITELDVTRAEVQLARAQSDQINLSRQRQLVENMLATLVGTPASVFCLEANPLTDAPPIIPTILPSELLQRRPDIAAAERNLAAAYAEVEAAYTGFYPSVNLNMTVGLQSPFADLLFDWRARLWQIGVSAIQTIFDGGRTEANFDYFKARFREVYANYEQVVLVAFQEVEDSLVNIRQKGEQSSALERAVKAASKTLSLSQERYNHGLVTYLDVVQAEEALLETEQNLTLVLSERYSSTVNLIKSLGGNWQADKLEECPCPEKEECN